jgi:hypothetical protein
MLSAGAVAWLRATAITSGARKLVASSLTSSACAMTSPLRFAGLWEKWRNQDEVVESCAIIVTEANELSRPIHDRMPVILPREACEV